MEISCGIIKAEFSFMYLVYLLDTRSGLCFALCLSLFYLSVLEYYLAELSQVIQCHGLFFFPLKPGVEIMLSLYISMSFLIRKRLTALDGTHKS